MEDDSAKHVRMSKTGDVSDSQKDGQHKWLHLTAPRLRPPTGLIVAFIMLVGVSASAAILGFGLPSSENDERREFNRIADDLQQQFDTAIHDYLVAGLWIHDACHDGQKSQEDFHLLYQSLKETGLEYQAVSFALNITTEERPFYENHTRDFVDDKYPELNYNGVVGFESDPVTGEVTVRPRGPDSFYYIVHYVEPLDDVKNQRALDFDIYTSPVRRAAVDEATATGLPALTERLKLIQETQEGTEKYAYSVIMMHPGLPERQSKDVAVIAIRIPELLIRAHAGFSLKEKVLVYLYDYSENPEKPPFLGGALLGEQANYVKFTPETELADVRNSEPRYIREVHLKLGSRTYTFVVASADDSFKPELRYIILGSAIIFAASVCISLWVFTSSRKVVKMNELKAEAEAQKAEYLLTSAENTAKAERELNDFIAHEVRNPLAAALSATSFVSSSVNEKEPLMTEESKATVREDVSIINNSLQFINELLRNMLDMHRASSKQLVIEKQEVNLLEDVIRPVASMLYRRGEDFRVEVDCPAHIVFLGDSLRLKQIALNLSRNSIKFVTTGFVRLRASINEENNIQLFIEDSGPGIPREKRENLFAKWQSSLDSLQQGTGIGLSLSYNLAELMGGKLWLDESYNSGVEGNPGARFVLDLNTSPISWEDNPTDETAETANASEGSMIEADLDLPKNLKILFVDDSFVLRKLFKRTISRLTIGWTFAEASDGESALLMVEDESFDMIFMDQ